MAIETIANFVEALRECRLLESAQQEEIERDLHSRFADPRALARELIQRGWLTPYQVNQLVQGHGQDLVLGAYRLLERLGSGGMGQVFKARHQGLGKVVALKIIRKEHMAKPEAVRRFHREVQIVAQMSHPNIVMAFDADQAGETHFLAMEYVDGIELLQLVKQAGPPPVADACEYMRQAALGLQHAHERGLVHRDIKPSNLLLTPRPTPGGPPGTIKILDMGLARIVAPTEQNPVSWQTQEGRVLGTPDYIAPEQALKSSSADVRADLYSLGCTFYFVLTGRVPFPGGTMMEKLLKHRMDEAEPVEKLRPEVPPALGAILRKLMAKQPEQRFQTPSEVVAALAGVFSSPDVPVATAVPVDGADDSAPVPQAIPLAQPASYPQAIRGGTGSSAETPVATLVTATDATDGVPLALPVEGSAFDFTAWSPRRKIVVGVTVGLVVVILLVLWFSQQRKPAEKRTEAVPTPTSALDGLIARAVDPKVPAETVRQELLTFARGQAGTAPAVRALQEVSRLPAPLDRLREVAVAGDDRPLALSSRDLVAVLGEHRQRHWGPVTCVACSPDGKWLASGSYDGTVCLWEADTLRPHARLSGHTGAIHGLAFSARGRLLASGSNDGSVRLWKDIDSAKPREEEVLRMGGSSIYAVAGAPEGNAFAFGTGNGAVYLLELTMARPYKPRLLTRVFNGWISALAFAPEGGTLAAAGNDRVIRLWDLESNNPLPPLSNLASGSAVTVRGLALSPGGKSLACSVDQSVQHWDLSGPKPRRDSETRAQVGTIYALAYSPRERQLAAAGSRGVIQVWNLDADEKLLSSRMLSGHRHTINALAFAQDGKSLVSASQDCTVRGWSLGSNTPRERTTLREHTASVAGLAFSPDGNKLATAGNGDLSVRLWDLVGTSSPEALVLPASQSLAIAFAPDGKRLAVAGSDRLVRLWDLSGNQPRETSPLRGHMQQVAVLAFAPDGKSLASGGGESTVWLWSLAGSEHRKLDAPIEARDAIVAAAFAPNGKTLVTGSQRGLVHFWDLTTAEPKMRLQLTPFTGSLHALAFAPDGLTLAVAGQSGTLRMLDLRSTTPKQRDVLTTHQRALTAVAYAPGGQYFASADENGLVLFWQVDSQRKPREWRLPGRVNSLAFSPDGRYLATGNGNGTAYILRVLPSPTRPGA